MTRILMLAGISSGSGKTLIAAGLAVAFKRRGLCVSSVKCGPDYIDPCFHARATGRACFNLDPWSMTQDTINSLVSKTTQGADLLIVEGVMGLFDDSQKPGRHSASSSAALAKMLGAPIVLIIGAGGTSQSLAATALGFSQYDTDIHLAGVIANRVASPRHETLIHKGFEREGVPKLLGCLKREGKATLPSRHLGLVQAQELDDLETTLDLVADHLDQALDLDELLALAKPLEPIPSRRLTWLPPLGQHMAIARDAAFAFSYPHLLESWQSAGASITFFSPLANEAPNPHADAIFLPGGYPELYLPDLSQQSHWQESLRSAARRGVWIYGECGGYMSLGETIIGMDGEAYPMVGLLPLKTSYAKASRRLHLGYRHFCALAETPFGPAGTRFRGHEFHYTATLETNGTPFFALTDSGQTTADQSGLHQGHVFGSFYHIIASETDE